MRHSTGGAREEVRKMVDEMEEALLVATEIMERTSKWSRPSFLALIGVLVYRRASDEGVDDMKLWDELYRVAVDVTRRWGI